MKRQVLAAALVSAFAFSASLASAATLAGVENNIHFAKTGVSGPKPQQQKGKKAHDDGLEQIARAGLSGPKPQQQKGKKAHDDRLEQIA